MGIPRKSTESPDYCRDVPKNQQVTAPSRDRSAARTAEEYLRWVRGHWGIENSLHWVLDVCFREDDQRHWAGNSAENLGWLRKLALCLLKAEKSRSSKGKSINTRRLIAGWKNDYLLTVLAQIPEKSGA